MTIVLIVCSALLGLLVLLAIIFKKLRIPLLMIITALISSMLVLLVYRPKGSVQEVVTEVTTEESTADVYTYEVEVQNEYGTIKSTDEILEATYPVWMKYVTEHNLPMPTYVDKTWEADDGLHAYLQSTFGDQTYEVMINDKTIGFNFYGSAFHKGVKGIAYGNVVLGDLNVASIEERLMSMGYSDLLFTIVEITPEKVILESETGFTQELSR